MSRGRTTSEDVRGRSGAHDAYPVRTVARLTGLSPDIIRAWEKRYGVVSPVRGPRGARLYTAADVAHLRLLACVVSGGRAIGDVARLGREALESLAGQGRRVDAAAPAADLTQEMLAALRNLDVERVEERLADALLALGGREFAMHVAAPLLTAVGEAWQDGRLSVAAEHVMSTILRNLLGGLVRTHRRHRRRPVLLATPSGERHEFGILLVGILVQDHGIGVCHLGADVPAAEVVAAAARQRVAVVGIGVVDTGNAERATAEIRNIERHLASDIELWVGGRSCRMVVDRLGSTRAVAMADWAALEVDLTRLEGGGIGDE